MSIDDHRRTLTKALIPVVTGEGIFTVLVDVRVLGFLNVAEWYADPDHMRYVKPQIDALRARYGGPPRARYHGG